MAGNLKIYQASAGSGKTFNLARVFVEMLLSKNGESLEKNLKSVMAITFTKKAANEMKERVLNFLEILSAGSESNTKAILLNDISENIGLEHEHIINRASKMLRIIMENYSDLSIGTIDSFNQRIVRSFARDLGVQFEFDINLNKDEWLEIAVDRLFERFADEKEDDQLTTTLIDFFMSQLESDRDSTWDLKSLVKKFASKNFNDELFDLFDKYSKLKNFDLAKIKNKLHKSINDYTKQVKSIGKKGYDLIRSAGLSASDFFHSKSGVVPFFENASNAEKLFDLPNKYVEKALNEDVWTSQKPSDNAQQYLPAIKAELHELLSQLVALKESGQRLRVNDLILKQIHFLSLVGFIENELESLKSEENTLLIDDFNRMIDKVVKNEPVPFIYERIGERYKHYLIDEFQDTAIKQWHNFVPLIDNALSAQNQNLIVGDGKQAIYRWRAGEVELFNKLPEIYAAEGELYKLYEQNFEREHEILNLKNNYRSRKEIVEFNNMFYDSIKTHLGEFDSVYDKHIQNPIRNEGGYVKVEVLDKEKVKENEFYVIKTLEAINESIEDGFSPGDIAVLARTGNQLKEIAEHLTKNNISIESSESLTLENQSGIQFLISILKYILNPDDKTVQYWLYHFIVTKFDPDPNLQIQRISKDNIPIKEKLIELGFEQNLKQASSLPMYQMSIELERSFKIGITLSAYFKTFLDLIEEFESKGGNQLDGFLDWWEERSHSISTPNNPNAVKLLTIHRAKGLEFPIVIFPFVDWKKRNTKDYNWVDPPKEIANELPKVLLKLNESISSVPIYGEVYNTEKTKTLLDNINLLYVATTRPTERLYLLTSDNYTKGNISVEIFEALQTLNIGENNVLEIGERIKQPKSTKKEGKIIDLPLKQFESTNRSDVIHISYEYKKYQNKKLKQALDYGLTIHQLLSEIETTSDLPKALDHSLHTGLISKDEMIELDAKLKRIFKITQVEEWFGVSGIKIRERDLIDKNGQVLRPDRIVITDKNVWVIDYKTGKINQVDLTKYKNQVTGYVNAMLDMGYKNVSGFLLSIEEEEVIPV